jgi:ATP-dependent Lon protease
MEERRRSYVLPIRDIVVFPGIIVPLFVGRPRSLKAIEMAMLEDRSITVVAQREMDTDDPGVDDLHSVGVLCTILQMVRIPDGTTKILIEGVEKVRLESIKRGKESLEADVFPLPWEESQSANLEALKRAVLEQFEKYVTLHPRIPAEVLVTVMNVDDPKQISDLVSSHLSVKVDRKQRLLEMIDPEKSLKYILKLLLEEIDILQLEHDIQDKVRQEVERGHKEFYLREQLKVIQDELGHNDAPSEIEELRKKVEEAEMPEAPRTKALHELDRLSKMPLMSAEATVVRTYIDWLVTLPWNKFSPDNSDVARAEKILEEDHYGLEKVKERILEFLAVRKLASGKMKGQVLCFVGPPGVGKTSLGKSVARALERKFVSMSLGGMRDEAEIRGHRRTYVGAMPGRIVQKLRQAGVNNPVLLMDEIDKMGQDFRGDPSAALLEALDPEQNSSFTDHFMEVAVDLSDVVFITTANVTHTIPKPLLDRMEVIKIPGYVWQEKAKIAQKHLFPRILHEHGLEPKQVKITPKALEKIISDYTREAGAPVDNIFSLVDEAFFIKPDEYGSYRFGQALVKSEPLPVPVAGISKLFHLVRDSAAVLFFPLPDLLHKLLPAEVVPCMALLRKHSLHHVLGGYSGMVRSREPEDVVPLHTLVPAQNILEGVVERMTHVQGAGYVRGWNNDGEGL